MVVGELFVNLGIKGSDKTVGALSGVERGMKDIKSVSLEAKAAILGAMYAVEQLFSKSGQQGTELTNFTALVGTSAKTLQEYEYAARQMGVSNEETANTFKTLQEAMTKTALNGKAPAGLAQVALLTGGMTAQDVTRAMANPELLMQRLQEYAQKEKRVGVRNTTLRSFGLSDNMIAAMARGGFNQAAFNKAPMYSDKEIANLDKANIAWSNLGNRIQMAIGHLNAAHGGEIVKDFGIIVDLGLKAAEIVLKLVERFKLFDRVGYVFDTISKNANSLYTQLSDMAMAVGAFGEKTKFMERFAQSFETIKQGAQALAGYFLAVGHSLGEIATASNLFEHLGNILTDSMDVVGKFAKVFGVLETSLIHIGEEFKVFQTIGEGLGVTLGVLESALKGIATVLDILAGGKEGDKAKQSLFDSFSGSVAGKSILKLVPPPDPTQAWTPNAPGVPPPEAKTQNININQNLNFPHANDPKATGDSVKRAVNDAFRQLNSLTQGS